MICDICNALIVGEAASLLTTLEVATSQECWKLYLRSSLRDGVVSIEHLDPPEFLEGLVGQLACSDTPWALCRECTVSLEQAGYSFRTAAETLPPSGHALCRSPEPMLFEVLDDEAVAKALRAAKAAALQIKREFAS